MSDFPTELSEQQVLNRAFDKSTNRLQTSGGTGSSSNQVQGTAADNAASVGNPVLSAGKYNATPPTYDDSDVSVDQHDVNGNKKVTQATAMAGENLPQDVLGTIFKPTINSAYSPSIYQNAGAATNANIKSTAGAVFRIRVTNANAAVRYFQIHNTTAAPAGAAVPQSWYLLPAGTAAIPSVTELGITDFAPSEYCSTGISFAVSTTAATFTDSATASEHFIEVRYL